MIELAAEDSGRRREHAHVSLNIQHRMVMILVINLILVLFFFFSGSILSLSQKHTGIERGTCHSKKFRAVLVGENSEKIRPNSKVLDLKTIYNDPIGDGGN